MKKIIAIYANLSKDCYQQLVNYAEDYRVIMEDEIKEEDYPMIEIIFGWNSKKIDPIIEKLTNLKWVQVVSAGTDYLPMSLRQNDRLLISNTSGIHAGAITESVFAYILGQGRGLYPSFLAQQEKKWVKISSSKMNTLPGKTILIFGTGRIGTEIARMAKAFGMKTKGVNSDGRKVDFFDKTYKMEKAMAKLSNAHIVLNALPLTDQTRGIFNKEFFDQMHPNGLFINIGRGPSVVEDDLYQAIKDKTIEGAYLDVFEREPLDADSPLWSCENIIITPHITGKMSDYDDKVFPIFIENLRKYIKEGTLKRNQYDRKKDY